MAASAVLAACGSGSSNASSASTTPPAVATPGAATPPGSTGAASATSAPPAVPLAQVEQFGYPVILKAVAGVAAAAGLVPASPCRVTGR